MLLLVSPKFASSNPMNSHEYDHAGFIHRGLSPVKRSDELLLQPDMGSQLDVALSPNLHKETIQIIRGVSLFASKNTSDHQDKKASFRSSISSSRRRRASSSLSSSLEPYESNTATLTNSTSTGSSPPQISPIEDPSHRGGTTRPKLSFWSTSVEKEMNDSNSNTPEEVKVQLTTAINDIWKLKKKIPSSPQTHSRDDQTMKNGSKIKIETPRNSKKLTIRNLWKRRHARSIEEGIRREQLSSTKELSNLLGEHSTAKMLQLNSEDANGGAVNRKNKSYAARTIAGLISALAEEATGLEVEVDARNDTPLWDKKVDAVKIQFQRLGFKQMRFGGLDKVLMDVGDDLSPEDKEVMADRLNHQDSSAHPSFENEGEVNKAPNSVDDVFDKIDVDNSGALDEVELARALSIASGVPDLSNDGSKRSLAALSKLASRLVGLYDTNGDGVVDREEYRKLVEDMTAVRDVQRTKQKERQDRLERNGGFQPLRWARNINSSLIKRVTENEATKPLKGLIRNSGGIPMDKIVSKSTAESNNVDFRGAKDISNDPTIFNTLSRGEGSIVFSGLKLDLRRLLFGALPVLKRITPGGPLILEPFTTTIITSFNRNDLLESALLDDGLRRLVARLLNRRVRSIRDLVDGAVFYGRTWNMASKQAPVVEVPRLTNIEFDSKNRLIITGRARTRVSPDQPFVENSFKLRTKLGTRENGQYIRLEDPELALVLECPRAWERNIVLTCKKLNLPIPKKPDPIYKFIPLVSPIKKTEQDGFNLGEDNRIKAIYVKDDALRFEMSTVLRPGRFLGNHYVAFTIPNRTVIMTMDRIREMIRNARKNKRELDRAQREKELDKKKEASDRYNRAVAQALSQSSTVGQSAQDLDLTYKKEIDENDLKFAQPDNGLSSEEAEIVPDRPSFLGRFLEGYLEAAREETERERNERLTTAISDFFGNIDTSKGPNKSANLDSNTVAE